LFLECHRGETASVGGAISSPAGLLETKVTFRGTFAQRLLAFEVSTLCKTRRKVGRDLQTNFYHSALIKKKRKERLNIENSVERPYSPDVLIKMKTFPKKRRNIGNLNIYIPYINTALRSIELSRGLRQ